jgi:predicted transposase YbfD/YdcC
LPKKTFEAAAQADAHLIVQLKENQPSLLARVVALCDKSAPTTTFETIDDNQRNRHETRHIGVYPAQPALAGTEWEDYVAAVIAVERTVHTRITATGLFKTSFERSFYLSNRPVIAQAAANGIRLHWRIETSNHYVRDVTFSEDASRIRFNPGVFARMRSFGLNILRKNFPDSFIPQARHKLAFGGLNALFALSLMPQR